MAAADSVERRQGSENDMGDMEFFLCGVRNKVSLSQLPSILTQRNATKFIPHGNIFRFVSEIPKKFS
jgi:hypothetical protein